MVGGWGVTVQNNWVGAIVLCRRIRLDIDEVQYELRDYDESQRHTVEMYASAITG